MDYSADKVYVGDVAQFKGKDQDGLYGVVFQLHKDDTVWIAVLMGGQFWKWCTPRRFLTPFVHRSSYHANSIKAVPYSVGSPTSCTIHTHYECSKCGYLEETFSYEPPEEIRDAFVLRMEMEGLCHYCAQGLTEKDAVSSWYYSPQYVKESFEAIQYMDYASPGSI